MVEVSKQATQPALVPLHSVGTMELGCRSFGVQAACTGQMTHVLIV